MDVDLDQRQRNIQREYLDFLDDGVRHLMSLLTMTLTFSFRFVVSEGYKYERKTMAGQIQNQN